MFFTRHVLPIIVLSGIVGFAVMTIMQRPATQAEIKIAEKPPAIADIPAPAMEMAVAATENIPATDPKPATQSTAIESEVQKISKPITETVLTPQGVSINITESSANTALVAKPDVESESIARPEDAVANTTIVDQKAANTEIRRVTVNEGDLLSEIALIEYGHAEYYHAIYAANKEKLSNANTLTPGQVLIIPSLEYAIKIHQQLLQDTIQAQ